MDNHRLALWCWWQHLDESDHWDFVHIDRHYDALWEQTNPWPTHSSPDHRTSLQSFRDATFVVNQFHTEDPWPLYRWDTITSALFSREREKLLDLYFATAGEGDRPLAPRMLDVKPWHVPRTLAYLATSEEHLQYPCIVDIDLDYFSHNDVDSHPFDQVFSDSYLADIGHQLKQGLSNGRFGVVTIALSPETTGSWALAEHLLSVLLSPFTELAEFQTGSPTVASPPHTQKGQ